MGISGRLALFLVFVTTAILGQTPDFDLVHLVNGNSEDRVWAVAFGPDGFLYLTGATTSTDFEVTPGSLKLQDPIHPTSNRFFVRRLSPDGTLLFSAALGPTLQTSNPVALAIDPVGNVYVAAVSHAEEWATQPANLEPNGSVVLLKLSADGSQLLYAVSLLPEAFYTGPLALVVDPAGAAYVATGGGPVAIRKVDPSGQRIVYQYNLPCGFTTVRGLALGPDQSLYLAGSTTCEAFPATPNAWRTSTAYPRNGEGFVIRLNPSGTEPIYATLLGGESTDAALAIDVDSSGRAVVVGSTSVSEGLAPMAAQPLGFMTEQNTQYGFLTALAPDGSAADYSLLLPVEALGAVALDDAGKPFVGGQANGGAVLAKVNVAARTLDYFMNPPALQAEIVSLDAREQRLAFGGRSFALLFPDGHASSNNTTMNGFAGIVPANPRVADIALTATATPARLEIYGSLASCRFRIENFGPDPAHEVTLRTAGNRSWQVDSPIFIVPGGAAGALILRLEPGESGEIEFQGQGGCEGSVQTATAETNLDNNTASDSYDSPPYVQVVVDASQRGVQFQRDDWPVLLTASPSSRVNVPAGGQVTIFFPTPQWSEIGLPVEFQSWFDGPTENPRVFTAGDQDMNVGARFRFLRSPAFDASTGLVNAATFQTGAIAPGEIVTLFGFNLGPGRLTLAGIGNDGRLVREIEGLQVTFDGDPAPFVYASLGQTSFIVPYSVAGKGSVKMRVQQNQESFEADVPVAATAPGLFTADATGRGQAIAFNQDQSLNEKESPVAPGEIVVLWATGEGLTDPAQLDGAPASVPLAKPVAPVTVTIGGRDAEIVYAGAAPGLTAGLMQLNVRIPLETSTSNHVPVTLTVGGSTSPEGVTLAIR